MRPPDTTARDDESAQERAVTTRQAGEILGIAEITLSQWRARGEGPRYFRIGRRHIRYRLADVLAWRDSRTVGRKVAP